MTLEISRSQHPENSLSSRRNDKSSVAPIIMVEFPFTDNFLIISVKKVIENKAPLQMFSFQSPMKEDYEKSLHCKNSLSGAR